MGDAFKRLSLVLILLASGSLACDAPDLLTSLTPAPSATPQVIIVVATPTAGADAGAGAAPVETPVPVQPANTPTGAVSVEGPDPVEARRIAIYQRAAPAVVNITTQVLREDFFWGAAPEEGSGSGFLWDLEGHIVTNYHVIEGAQRIEVSFGGDTTVPAEVVGGDRVNDLAVIRVERAPDGVQPLETGESASLQVGQTAIVIGNPFGQFERTMTVGIISALNRTIETDSAVLRGVIQTDAAINQGNSGGPLLDSLGRLIGVNSAIYSPTGTSAGVGLAIPVDKVRRVVPVLIAEGRFPHPWLGIEQLGYELSPVLAEALGLGIEQGLLIARLYNDSPADRAGIRGAQQEVILGNRRFLIGGDVLTAIDGKPLATWEDVNEYLEESARVGQVVTLTVVRDGQELTLQATLSDMPESLRPG